MNIANQFVPALSSQVGAGTLPALVQRAAKQLASASTAAEILEARLSADIAYDEAKKTARMAQALAAHDELISKVHEAQGEALKIKAQASRLYYEETQAAIDRGEIPGRGGDRGNQHTGGKVEDANFANPTQHKQINHEGKLIADAEKAEPGIVGRIVDERIASGQEPTKTALREAVIEAAKQGIKGESRPSNRNPNYIDDPAYKMLLQVLGPCRALMEKVDAGEVQVATILNAFLDADHRQRALRDIHRARDFLTTVLETVNAH